MTCNITTTRHGNGYDYRITRFDDGRQVAFGWVQGTRQEAVRHACREAERLGYEVPL